MFAAQNYIRLKPMLVYKSPTLCSLLNTAELIRIFRSQVFKGFRNINGVETGS